MYYVLFTWIKGTKERDFQGFRTKPELIDFLGKNFEKIIVWNIHKAATEYRFGLVEKESKPEEEGGAFLNDLTEESDEEKPADYLGSLKPAEQKAAVEAEAAREEKRREKGQHPYVRNKEEQKSAMEKIADDIEVEIKENNLTERKTIKLESVLTDEEIIAENKEALEKMSKAPTIKETLNRGDKAIAAAEEEQKKAAKGWTLCPECNFHHVAPWNKTGICSVCQRPKGKRPYKRREKK